MSAVAAARKRRAGPLPPDPSKSIPQSAQNAPSSPAPSGLTLPQVIALVDKRLVVLEKFMNDRSSSDSPIVQNTVESVSGPSNEVIQEINDVLDDFNSRFVLLTEEIANLKDIVLKLQSFTMDVNKKLVEERLGNVEFVLENPVTNSEAQFPADFLPTIDESIDSSSNNENA